MNPIGGNERLRLSPGFHMVRAVQLAVPKYKVFVRFREEYMNLVLGRVDGKGMRSRARPNRLHELEGIRAKHLNNARVTDRDVEVFHPGVQP
ncbi:MAG: hypothetical protein ACREEC_00920 [Thermoplasmata archaeon]